MVVSPGQIRVSLPVLIKDIASCFSGNCFPGCVDLVWYSGQEWRWNCQVQPDCPEWWQWVSCLLPNSVGFSSLSNPFSSYSLHHSHILLFCLCILELHCEWLTPPGKCASQLCDVKRKLISPRNCQSNYFCRYNSTTGVFTVPPGGAGHYYFSTYLLLDEGDWAIFELRINGDRICRAHGDDDDSLSEYAQAACSGLTVLKEGQKVNYHKQKLPEYLWRVTATWQKPTQVLCFENITKETKDVSANSYSCYWLTFISGKQGRNNSCFVWLQEMKQMWSIAQAAITLHWLPHPEVQDSLDSGSEQSQQRHRTGNILRTSLSEWKHHFKETFLTKTQCQCVINLVFSFDRIRVRTKGTEQSDKLSTILGVWDQKGFTEFIVCEIWNSAISTTEYCGPISSVPVFLFGCHSSATLAREVGQKCSLCLPCSEKVRQRWYSHHQESFVWNMDAWGSRCLCTCTISTTFGKTKTFIVNTHSVGQRRTCLSLLCDASSTKGIECKPQIKELLMSIWKDNMVQNVLLMCMLKSFESLAHCFEAVPASLHSFRAILLKGWKVGPSIKKIKVSQ